MAFFLHGHLWWAVVRASFAKRPAGRLSSGLTTPDSERWSWSDTSHAVGFEGQPIPPDLGHSELRSAAVVLARAVGVASDDVLPLGLGRQAPSHSSEGAVCAEP